MKLNKNQVFSVLLIAFAGFVIYETTQLQSLFAPASGDVGPRFFPMAAAVCLVICSIGKLVTESKRSDKPLFTGEGWRRVGIMFLLLVLYLVAMTWLGYLISTLVFTPLLVVAMKEERRLQPIALVLFSVATTALLYVVFQMVIQVSLPVGKLFR
ncbi:MAG: tripartite tricarboxylate transporter TctB family protein [Lawsonibacter sp.]|nr:tripartite tricarboxylate transporter TctB family protein [Lawsonibacter sp.]